MIVAPPSPRCRCEPLNFVGRHIRSDWRRRDQGDSLLSRCQWFVLCRAGLRFLAGISKAIDIASSVTAAVQEVTKAWTKQRKAEERDRSRRAHR